MQSQHAAARQIRGSGLLLAGRFIGLAVGFAAQVVIVRYLAKGDFGALAYALSVVSLAASVAAFGLDKATSRFLPIYDERDDRGRGLGLIVLGLGTMATIGLIIVGVVLLAQGALAGASDPTAIAALAVLIVLAPVQAIDPLFTAILAALGRPRAIFVRRYLVEPAFEVALIVVVIVVGAGVAGFAIGYALAGLAGLAIYAVVVARALRAAGFLTRSAIRDLVVPWREVFKFSLPLLSSDVVFVLRGALVVVLLEAYGTALDVADFRAVFPQARLNLVVLQSFTFLYLPLAARLHERADRDGLRESHRRTTSWIALLTFPAFAASFALAEPLVGLLYGERYLGSAPILAILSLGFFVSAVLGLAGLSLRAVGSVRYVFVVDIVTALAALAAYFLVIPAYGALGAAVGTAGILAVQAVAYAVGVRRAVAIGSELGGLVRLIGLLLVAAVGLLAVQLTLRPPLPVGIGLVLAVWGVLLWRYRRGLDLAGTFPEVTRVPLVGRLLAPASPPAREVPP